jgi:hypothetical protein
MQAEAPGFAKSLPQATQDEYAILPWKMIGA